MAAAPGGKTTQIAAETDDKGIIIVVIAPALTPEQPVNVQFLIVKKYLLESDAAVPVENTIGA